MKSKKYIVSVSKPCEGSFGKTGSWRFVKPIIDYEKCTKCKFCWLYCPEASIKIRKDGYPEIDYDYCKGCGICYQECPKKCIKLVRET